jgi:ATP-dependent Clp protease ATP-binding subunit ClpC
MHRLIDWQSLQVIGREKEVARVVQVLARKRKNNPILLGDPGVGKTAIAEGLARAIVTGWDCIPLLMKLSRSVCNTPLLMSCHIALCFLFMAMQQTLAHIECLAPDVPGSLPDGSALPVFLKGKRVMSLDLGLLIAGAKERGELESRVTSLLSEIRAAGNIVLM